MLGVHGGGAVSGTLSGAGTLALGDIGYTTTGIAGTGTLALTNSGFGVGTLTATATGTITDSVLIDGGAKLAAAAGNILTISGPLTIGASTVATNGGTFTGPGTITTTGVTTIADLGTTQVLSLQGGANWINTGSVTESGAGNYNTAGVDGDTDSILNKGSFTFAGPDAGFGLSANGTDIFTNTGTLARTGAGTSILDGTVNSSGTINVAGGVLQVQRGGGALSGTLSGAGTLALGDIGYTTTGLSGSGTLALNNNYQIGTLTASATGTITDSLQIDGGATLAAAAGTTPDRIGAGENRQQHHLHEWRRALRPRHHHHHRRHHPRRSGHHAGAQPAGRRHLDQYRQRHPVRCGQLQYAGRRWRYEHHSQQRQFYLRRPRCGLRACRQRHRHFYQYRHR